MYDPYIPHVSNNLTIQHLSLLEPYRLLDPILPRIHVCFSPFTLSVSMLYTSSPSHRQPAHHTGFGTNLLVRKVEHLSLDRRARSGRSHRREPDPKSPETYDLDLIPNQVTIHLDAEMAKRAPTQPRPRQDQGKHYSYPNQQEHKTGDTSLNLPQDLRRQDSTKTRGDTQARRQQPQNTSPHRTYLISTKPASQKSFSKATKNISPKPPNVAHLRRNAISFGLPLEDYRYRTGQATEREKMDEGTRCVRAELGPPADSLASERAVVDREEEEIGGDEGWRWEGSGEEAWKG